MFEAFDAKRDGVGLEGWGHGGRERYELVLVIDECGGLGL